MVIFDFFIWWYSDGYRDLLSRLHDTVFRIWHFFSVNLLFKTLFSPWKRIISYPGKSIQAQFRALIDNLVSRLVGFFVRTIMIIAAVIVVALTVLIGAVLLIGWPLAPVIIIGLVIFGLTP